MRGSRQRPTSQHGMQSPIALSTRSARKVFNCIVDDSALVAGVKRSTRNGIRQWVKNGQIRLFVPLHALEQLSRQKNATNRHGEDVRETLQWLDEATSKHPNMVTLQGADETYENWAEVERFAVPRTLFSEDDGMEEFEAEPELDQLPDEDMNKLSLNDVRPKTPTSSVGSNATGSFSPSSMRSQRSLGSAFSPPTSPIKPSSPGATQFMGSRPTSLIASSAIVPQKLQPLFNYILWRIHQEIDPVAALESFIFLCNDQNKVHYAKGFEIKTKRLEQLREAVVREDRDFRNRQMLINRENQNATMTASPTSPRRNTNVDDETTLRSPPKAPAAMLSKQPQQPNVIDPDAFGRDSKVVNYPPQPTAQLASPRQKNKEVVHGGRGNGHSTFTRGANGRGNFRGASRGRGTFAGTGRGAITPNNRTDGVPSGGQIDPDSFSRPRGGGYAGRGGRKLWVPT